MLSDTNIKSLAASLGALIVFVASLYGHQFDTMTVTQLLILGLSAIGTLAGIFMKHDKPMTNNTTIVLPPNASAQEYIDGLKKLQEQTPVEQPRPPTQP